MQTFAAIPVFRRVYKYVSAVNTGKKETAMKEIKIMNTNTLELNMSEMEQVKPAPANHKDYEPFKDDDCFI